MRNLKKILALVLALVMSLSLMATAGAAETTTAASNPYATAQEVLEGLKVFQGNPDGSMNYDQSVTRVQTAALVYRIATSDVTDAQKDMYTNHAFKDVAPTYWGNGYIGYGYNAEIIKGMGDGTFHPDDNVTGYQVLAMILRTLGYGKNHEFEGTNWEVQTAATAKREGLLNGITAADEALLGQPASRGLVAQILFNALLQPTVKFSALNPYNYEKDATTLGYQKFTLEEVTGVVVANEYAGILRGDNVTTGKNPTSAGKSVLYTKDNKAYQIDVATGLDDLGMTRIAYTTRATLRDDYNSKCLALIDAGTDVVKYDGGEKKDNLNGLGLNDLETERYLNFGESTGSDTTNIKVSYAVKGIVDTVYGLDRDDAMKNFRADYHLTANVTEDQNSGYGWLTVTSAGYAGSGRYTITYQPGNSRDVTTTTATDHIYNVYQDAKGSWWYRVEIAPNTVYGGVDAKIIQYIFNYAGLERTLEELAEKPSAVSVRVLEGEVYRGTQFVTDYSDTKTYEEFLDDCIDDAGDNINDLVNGNQRGWWLKVIDNDGDGVTDWVFQTRYTVAKVSAVAEDGTLTLDTPNSGTEAKDINRGGTNEYKDNKLNSKSLWGGSNHANYNDNINSTKRNANGTTTAKNESGETISVGDVMYFAYIDDANYAWKCDVVEGRVDSINRSKLTVTMDGDATVYEESAVHEHSTSTDIISGVINMSGTTNLYLYLDAYNNVAAFSQNIAGNLVLLVDGWAKSVINGTEYAAKVWNKETKAIDTLDIANGGSLFISGTNNWTSDENDGINSWNRIRSFVPLNDNDTHNSNIRTMVAYMETNGDNNTLVPVDTVWDVERQNQRGIAMIDLGTTVPGNQPVKGTVWQTSALTVRQPYDNRLTPDTSVRALSNTMYYYVWRNSYGISVTQFEGYANGAKAINSSYVEDVYAVGTRAEDVNGVYYTANVVVVELKDTYHPFEEEVFIYNMPVVGTWGTIEEVEAIGANGETRTIKVDITTSRTYTEATGSAGSDGLGNSNRDWSFTPGLYYLIRTNRSDSDNIWAVVPMSHKDIRESGHYDVGDIVTSYNTLTYNYAQVRDYVCGDYTDGVIGDDHDRTQMIPDPDEYSNTPRKNTDSSKYYSLSYNNSTYTYPCFGTATPDTAANVLRQWYNPGNTSDLNHNQVLVRYDGSNNIVYAVSFEHLYNKTSENYAQQVWRGMALDQFKYEKASDFGTFYGYKFGVNANGTAYVEKGNAAGETGKMALTYKDVLDKDPITGLKVNYQISTTTPQNTPAYPVEGVDEITIVVKYNDKNYTFTFSVDEARTNNDLVVDDKIIGFDEDGNLTDLGTRMRIYQYKEAVEALQKPDYGQTLIWNFFNDAGPIKDETENIQSGEIRFWTITVVSESGDAKTYVSKGADGKVIVVEADNDGLALPDGTKVKLEKTDTEYKVTVLAEPGVEPVIVVNGNVYRMEDLGVVTKALSALAHTWTRTLTADEVGTDTVIYIRAIVGGDKPIDLPTTDTPASPADREGAKKVLDAAKEILAGLTELDADTKAELEALVKDAEALIDDKTATKTEIDAAVKAAVDAINAAAGIEETNYDLTVTIGENITKVEVKITPAEGEATTKELTESGTVSVPAGAKVEFTVTPAEGYEKDTYSADIAKMEGTESVSFTVKKTETPVLKPNEKIQAIIDGDTYKFYSYKGDEAPINTINEDQAKAALIAAVADGKDTTGATIVMADGTAIVTIGGKSTSVKYEKTAANAGSMAKPNNLYAVTVDDALAGYFTGNTKIPTTLEEDTPLLVKSTVVAGSAAATVGADGKTGNYNVTDNVTLVPAVAIKVGVGSAGEWSSAGIKVYNDTTRDWVTATLTDNSTNTLYVQKDTEIRFTEKTATPAKVTSNVTVDDKALTKYTVEGDGTTPKYFDVKVADLIAADDAKVTDLTVSKVVNYKFYVDGVENSDVVTNGGNTYLKLGEKMLTTHPYYVTIAKGSTPTLGYENTTSGTQSAGIPGEVGEYLQISDAMKSAVHDDGYVYLASLVKVTFAANTLDTPSAASITPSWTKPGVASATTGAAVSSIVNTSAKDLYFVKGSTLAFTANGTDKNIIQTVGTGDEAVVTSVAKIGFAGDIAKATAYPVTVEATISLNNIVRGNVQFGTSNFKYKGADDAAEPDAIADVTFTNAAFDLDEADYAWLSGASAAEITDEVGTTEKPDATKFYKVTITGVKLAEGYEVESIAGVTVDGATVAGPCTMTETANGSGVYTVVLIVKASVATTK